MSSVLTYALLPLFYFPFATWTVWQGGTWPALYLGLAILLYVGVDNLTPPLTDLPDKRYSTVYNALLLLQLPLSIVLLAVLLAKLGAASTGTLFISSVTGLHFVGFDSFGEALLASAAAAFQISSNKVVAHELMHRPSRFLRGCSRFLLTMVGDPQFQEAHVYGHHMNVGTARDAATARQGESFYRFLLRSTIGQCKEAYEFERKRLRGKRLIAGMARHRVLRAHVLMMLLLVLTAVFFGAWALIGWLIVIGTARVLLEEINYIQHYGLVREDGDKVQAVHSWDCDSRNLLGRTSFAGQSVVWVIPDPFDHRNRQVGDGTDLFVAQPRSCLSGADMVRACPEWCRGAVTY